MPRLIARIVPAWAAGFVGLAMAMATAGPAEVVDLRGETLTQPAATLSRSLMGAAGRDVTLYDGLILPMCRRLELTPEKNRADLDIGGTTCGILFDRSTGKFKFEVGRQTAIMDALGPGLAPQAVTVAGRSHSLAFPRSFSFMSNGVVFYTPACVQQGKLGDEVLALFDDNADGLYNTADALRLGPVGPTNLFVPIQDFVTTGRSIYKIEQIDKDGARLSVSRYSGPTAKVVAQFAPTALTYQLGLASDQAKVSFTVSSPTPSDKPGESKSVEFAVIPGRYRIMYGLVSSAEGKVVAFVLPRLARAGGPLWTEVTAEKPLLVPVGPARLDCEVGTERMALLGERRADFVKVSIPSESLAFRGSLGEEYIPIDKPDRLTVELYEVEPGAQPPTTRPTSRLVFRLENLTKDSRGAFSFIAATAAGLAGLEPLRGTVRLKITVTTAGLTAVAEKDVRL